MNESPDPTSGAGKQAESAIAAPEVPSEPSRPETAHPVDPRRVETTEAEPSLADLEAEALEAQLLGDYDRARAAQAKIDARTPKLASVIPLFRRSL